MDSLPSSPRHPFGFSFHAPAFAAALAVALVAIVSLTGCKDESSTTGPGAAGNPATPPAPATAPAAGSGGGAHPNATPLGEQTVGGLQLTAMQDGQIQPGGEGAFDLKVAGPKPKAVRFWVGVENGEGSVKARAEEESPGNWHTHVEVPDPLPPGSKFWAEIEPQQGAKQTVSFDLK